jgi:hypothetical protein
VSVRGIVMGATAVAVSLVLGCYRDRIVERPVPITPPPCLTEVGPRPPDEGDDSDAAWEHYHVRLEAWAAMVERACGKHLLPAATP